MAEPKPLSPHIGFYKSFGRPLTKMLLISYCVYQVGIYTWTRFESNEMKLIKQNELDSLAGKLQSLDKERKP